MTPAVAVLQRVLDAWDAQRDPGHSDLDNEQPITLHVRTTLGEIRQLRIAMHRAGAVSSTDGTK